MSTNDPIVLLVNGASAEDETRNCRVDEKSDPEMFVSRRRMSAFICSTSMKEQSRRIVIASSLLRDQAKESSFE
jgi:hypothetical protein